MSNSRITLYFVFVFFAGWISHRVIAPLLPGSPLSNVQLSENKNKSLIFQLSDPNTNEPMLINSVSVIQNRPSQLILEVEYTYRGSIPPEQIKLFVYMGSPFTYIGNIDVLTGTHKRRVSIGIVDSELKRQEKNKFHTSEITLSFDHYAPEQYIGSKFKTSIVFDKEWAFDEK